MKPIGGYFELELPSLTPMPLPYEGVRVNSGRNALEYILRSIGIERISKLYLPYFTCEVVLQPINALGIKYEFYHIDRQLKIADPPDITEGEYIIVNNYFGILDEYVTKLTKRYFGQIIVDNSQALMTPVSLGQMAFYSPRKFVGIPDGGIACTFHKIELSQQVSDQDSLLRSAHLLKRLYGTPSSGYKDFKRDDDSLDNLSTKKMSSLTETMLNSFDFNRIVEIRKENYNTLRNSLEHYNLLKTPKSSEISCPMVYPFLTDNPELRSHLIKNQIFVATYWPNVLQWCPPQSIETTLVNQCLPLPIDQRYNSKDMNRIIETILHGKI